MDTLYRQWAMLKRIPRDPQRITVAELDNYLREEGYIIDRRSIQRDLDKLSTLFPLNCEVEGRTYYWFWLPQADALEIPGMSTSAALVMRLSEDFLSPLIPRSLLTHLKPYYQRAGKILQGTPMALWSSKVKIIHRGPILQPPAIDEGVLDVLYEALLNDQCFEVEYDSRQADQPKSFEVHPLGLVIKHSVMYLVATLWDYDDIRQLAVHRIHKPNLLDKAAHRSANFDLDSYIHQEQGFSYPYDSKHITLQLRFNEEAAFHLTETPLSEDQVLTQKKDGSVILKATVLDTEELRWWILGFGQYVEVLKPKALRSDIANMLSSAANLYSDAT